MDEHLHIPVEMRKKRCVSSGPKSVPDISFPEYPPKMGTGPLFVVVKPVASPSPPGGKLEHISLEQGSKQGQGGNPRTILHSYRSSHITSHDHAALFFDQKRVQITVIHSANSTRVGAAAPDYLFTLRLMRNKPSSCATFTLEPLTMNRLNLSEPI